MALRRDARDNRARLLVAAREVFAESGATSPLELVARRAGVGRGTLYRNFPDRSALLAALFEERLGLLEDLVAAYDGDDVLERLLVEICWYEVVVPGLGALLPTGADEEPPGDGLQRVSTATQHLIDVALRRSLEAGAVRPDLTVSDALLVIAMVHGAVASAGADASRDVVHRALGIALDGIRPDGRVGADVPRPGLPDRA